MQILALLRHFDDDIHDQYSRGLIDEEVWSCARAALKERQ